MKWFLFGMAFMWPLDVYDILPTEVIRDFVNKEIVAIAEDIVER